MKSHQQLTYKLLFCQSEPLAERLSDDMNHNDTTNELNLQTPISFTRLGFHYFPSQRKCKTKTSGPVDGFQPKLQRLPLS